MKKVLVLVEGQTEDKFVRDVLSPHFWNRGIALQPKIVATKRVKHGPHFKGGVISYAQVKNVILRLLRDSSAARITTMLDLYALPSDFPGQRNKPTGNAYARIKHLERSFAGDINDSRFIPHLVLHEFEALIFVDPSCIAFVFGNDMAIVRKLVQIRDDFASPEDIDEGPLTAPSKRLLEIFPFYQKPLHGPLATTTIGLDKIRASCTHFKAWIMALESI